MLDVRQRERYRANRSDAEPAFALTSHGEPARYRVPLMAANDVAKRQRTVVSA